MFLGGVRKLKTQKKGLGQHVETCKTAHTVTQAKCQTGKPEAVRQRGYLLHQHIKILGLKLLCLSSDFISVSSFNKQCYSINLQTVGGGSLF